MIYPSGRAVISASCIAPAALLIALLLPQWWFAGLAILAFLLALFALDALAAPRRNSIDVEFSGPGAIEVGAEFSVDAHILARGSGPAFAELAVSQDPVLVPRNPLRRRVALENGAGFTSFAFLAPRRGKALIEQAWLRWPGPLGLVWVQRQLRIAQEIAITPDTRPVRERGAQMLHRDSTHGQTQQLKAGEGAEFESLAEYRPGMDRRTIDWRQSARHTTLVAKEYRSERNNNILLALDAGRAMCEPLAGVPRIDRVISAALLNAYVALREGDRVGLFAFDSHPRLASKPLSGGRAFAHIQRLASRIDYSPRETNYTLALATLAAGMHRRSLVIVFTEFTDSVSAELMLAATGPLLKRHLVLFVVFKDEELEAFAQAEPFEPADVTRAVTAAALLRERQLVITRLRHLGVHVLEAAHDEAGPALVNAYLAFKRKNML